mmetsp:Transcript_12210/g.15941  ORF Transcript_12210/g.15941 Transcript_12210/m.15941 type:complete len:82 (-) Transcript_12210:878-1123(-)
MCIMNVAKLCQDDDFECDLDQISAIKAQLEDQVEVYNKRLDEIDQIFNELNVENNRENEVRDVDYIRNSIRSVARLFSIDS